MSNDPLKAKRSWVDKRMDCTPEGVFARLCTVVKTDVERIRKMRESDHPGKKRLPRQPDITVCCGDETLAVMLGTPDFRLAPRVDFELDGNRIKAKIKTQKLDAAFAVSVTWCPKTRRCRMAYEDCTAKVKHVRHISQRALEPLFFG